MVTLWVPKYFNCVLWGIYVMMRYGAKLQIVSSRSWDVIGGNWHLICIFKDGAIRSYVPVDPTPVTTWTQVIKTTTFEGKVVDEYGQRNRTVAG